MDAAALRVELEELEHEAHELVESNAGAATWLEAAARLADRLSELRERVERAETPTAVGA
jgi:hypothetical protein